ncbi:ribosomal RNA-processing protein 1, partial [Phenoliferia sp. Uapishka_3]
MSAASTSSNAMPLPRPKKVKAKKVTLKPSSSTPPLGKFLASSEKPVRDKAVASLARFLAGTKNAANLDGEDASEEELVVGELDWDVEYELDSRLAPGEMAKLWKGVFYCFWMSDKPLVQQALASDLALLTLSVRPKTQGGRSLGRVARFTSAMSYLRAFWDAIVREWSGLDRLRLDKFYLLIRRFVHVGFVLLKREQWDPQAISLYNELLTGPGGPLHVVDPKIPQSIAYHLSDIFIDELEASLSRPLTSSIVLPSAPVPINHLLQPLFTTLAVGPTTTLFQRLSDNGFEPLILASIPQKEVGGRNKKRKAVEAVEEEDLPFKGILGLGAEREKVGRGVLKAMFDEGGKKETGEVARRRIYALVAKWDVEV